MNSELKSKLENLAYKKTIPFCYGCYQEASTGVCESCHSDDLMRLLPGVGCEYGTRWVIESLISEALEPVDTDAAFTDLMQDCYSEPVKIGFMEFDAVYAMKSMHKVDKVSWDIAREDYVSSQVEDGVLITFDNGSNYYQLTDIENFIEENEDESEDAT